MAAYASTSGSAEPPLEAERAFQTYYTEVKEIEQRDSVLTSKQQMDRLLRPGSTYFNLNPFEVSNPSSVELKRMCEKSINPSGEQLTCHLTTHEFSANIMDNTVHFYVLRLKDSFFVWIGSRPVLNQLAVAVSTRFERSPISTMLMGNNTDLTSSALATRLAKKTGKQVFVSYSLDPGDKMMFPLVEKRLKEEMVLLPDKF